MADKNFFAEIIFFVLNPTMIPVAILYLVVFAPTIILSMRVVRIMWTALVLVIAAGNGQCN